MSARTRELNIPPKLERIEKQDFYETIRTKDIPLEQLIFSANINANTKKKNRHSRSNRQPLSIKRTKSLNALDRDLSNKKTPTKWGGIRQKNKTNRKNKTNKTHTGGTPTPCVEITDPKKIETKLQTSIDTVQSSKPCSVKKENGKCEIQIDDQIIIPIGTGANNAVVLPPHFVHCNDPTKYVLRVSTRAFDTKDSLFQKATKVMIHENQLNVLAAQTGLSNKIYDIGVFMDHSNTSNVYFYSILEKINGGDLFDYLANFIDSCYTTPADKIQERGRTLVKIVNKALDVSEKIGNAGFFMSDNKPENIMENNKEEPDINNRRMYIIDFGALTDYDETKEKGAMFADLNKFMFLLNICARMKTLATQYPNTYMVAMIKYYLPLIYSIYERYKETVNEYYRTNKVGFNATYNLVNNYHSILDLKHLDNNIPIVSEKSPDKSPENKKRKRSPESINQKEELPPPPPRRSSPTSNSSH